jgi:hypothetical protein
MRILQPDIPQIPQYITAKSLFGSLFFDISEKSVPGTDFRAIFERRRYAIISKEITRMRKYAKKSVPGTDFSGSSGLGR